MLEPVFDITPEEIAPDQWMHCRLVLEVNACFLQYAILQDKKLLRWTYYQLPPASPAEKLVMVGDIFKTAALHSSVKEHILLYNFSRYCLLPEAFFDINLNRPFLDTMQGDLDKGPVISEKITGWPLYNVFRLPPGLEELCKKEFVTASSGHHVSLWLACLDKQQEGVHLLFSGDEMGITLLREGKLHLVQSYPHQSHSDSIYHLLNLFIRFGLDHEQTPVYLSGMVAPASPLYQNMLKYFALLQPAALSPDFNVSAAFRSVPDYFFSPLLKIAACV